MTIQERIASAEAALKEQFAHIDAIEEHGTRRILKTYQDHMVAYRHFAPTTGYGYDDVGRDTLEHIFADLFGTQAAIVRPQIASGTHAISLCLFGLTLPGDHILSATGRPYDTLEGIIGWGEGEAPIGSLKEMGVTYQAIDDYLLDGKGDPETIAKIESVHSRVTHKYYSPTVFYDTGKRPNHK